jgi:hypothetical protein
VLLVNLVVRIYLAELCSENKIKIKKRMAFSSFDLLYKRRAELALGVFWKMATSIKCCFSYSPPEFFISTPRNRSRRRKNIKSCPVCFYYTPKNPNDLSASLAV